MPKKTKPKLTEDSWDKIAQEAIEKAEAVDCAGPQFVAGLREIVTVLRDRLESAVDEFGDPDDDEDEEGEDDEGTGEDGDLFDPLPDE